MEFDRRVRLLSCQQIIALLAHLYVTAFYWIQFLSLSGISDVSFFCSSSLEIWNNNRKPLHYTNWVLIVENRINNLIPYSPTTSKHCVSTFWKMEFDVWVSLLSCQQEIVFQAILYATAFYWIQFVSLYGLYVVSFVCYSL